MSPAKHGIQVRRTTASGDTPAKPATIMITPATGDTGRRNSLASCSIMASTVGSPPNPAATVGAIGTSPVKDATPDPVSTVTMPITAESTRPVPIIPNPADFAASIMRPTRPAFFRPSAKSAATKMRPTTLCIMWPMPLNIAKPSWKQAWRFRRCRRSTRIPNTQPMNIAIATSSTTVL